jgi:hypothetical protein
MLDANFALETTRSIPFEADVLPDPKRLSPGNRLDVIASILAVAVLRSKVRKAVPSNNLEDIEESSGTTGEGLD